MPEIRTVTILAAKRDEIEAAITNYERRLDQAGADLSHVDACIAIFEACDEPSGTPPISIYIASSLAAR